MDVHSYINIDRWTNGHTFIHVSGKYKESFRLSKNLKTSLVYPRKDSNVVSVGDHVHL